MQAKYGDADENAPSKFWLVDWVKWNAWNRVRGMSPRVAVRNFIRYAEAMLAYLLSNNPKLQQEGENYVLEQSQDFSMF